MRFLTGFQRVFILSDFYLYHSENLTMFCRWDIRNGSKFLEKLKNGSTETASRVCDWETIMWYRVLYLFAFIIYLLAICILRRIYFPFALICYRFSWSTSFLFLIFPIFFLIFHSLLKPACSGKNNFKIKRLNDRLEMGTETALSWKNISKMQRKRLHSHYVT